MDSYWTLGRDLLAAVMALLMMQVRGALGFQDGTFVMGALTLCVLRILAQDYQRDPVEKSVYIRRDRVEPAALKDAGPISSSQNHN
ncbi:hypothetical protein [Gluconobacter aidae]|uniref:Uncharacterized protein n=1 Tax=Gluconobacter aidae TaxID=2662454 RepID=A0A7X1SQ38_9PROT|nr:hypothetical protein [Gluconobacter aidae]MQR99077.1 hypothetical protein [Gluconobacter aidae]